MTDLCANCLYRGGHTDMNGMHWCTHSVYGGWYVEGAEARRCGNLGFVPREISEDIQ